MNLISVLLAVGTPLIQRPLHRSGYAVFLHLVFRLYSLACRLQEFNKIMVCPLFRAYQSMIIISANPKNLDYASQAPLHPGYTGCVLHIRSSPIGFGRW